MTINLADPAALAASVQPPTRAVIGGRSVDSASGKTFATLNPATGAELAQVTECDAEDVDRAVTAARTAFEELSEAYEGLRRMVDRGYVPMKSPG